jgi:hypothetical protein
MPYQEEVKISKYQLIGIGLMWGAVALACIFGGWKAGNGFFWALLGTVFILGGC